MPFPTPSGRGSPALPSTRGVAARYRRVASLSRLRVPRPVVSALRRLHGSLPADATPPYEDLLGRASYEVCPMCAYEFGNDDNPGTAPPTSFEDYRDEWVGGWSPGLLSEGDAPDQRVSGLRNR